MHINKQRAALRALCHPSWRRAAQYYQRRETALRAVTAHWRARKSSMA